ncbi:MAG: peptidase [Frankiales bacterium]|nr:peptidase [Frankiales bacterium]
MVDAACEDLCAFLRPGVRENVCVGLVSELGSEHVEGVDAISRTQLVHVGTAVTAGPREPLSRWCPPPLVRTAPGWSRAGPGRVAVLR